MVKKWYEVELIKRDGYYYLDFNSRKEYGLDKIVIHLLKSNNSNTYYITILESGEDMIKIINPFVEPDEKLPQLLDTEFNKGDRIRIFMVNIQKDSIQKLDNEVWTVSYMGPKSTEVDNDDFQKSINCIV